MPYRLGVDVGGTFTDLLMIDEDTGETWRAKTPSTPADPSIGVLAGLDKVCQTAAVDPGAISHLMHGTTVATNAILEGKGARVGLVVTEGYRQVLQVARSFVPGGLAGWIIWPKPEPLAALEHTVEVAERVGARGEVLRPLDEASVRAALAELRRRQVEALTVSLVNSFANPAHERRILELAADELPGVPVSLSSDILPEIREYERTLTTVANSYVRPVVSRYLGNLERELGDRKVGARLHVLRSDGGLMSVEAAKQAPVNMLMSGPAGGVTGALWIAEKAGYDNLLTFDMGGTSTDVALVQQGRPRVGRETAVGDLNVRASSVDVRTVGAGGGSIAHVPELTRALRVGPQSAGAEPGPAAYGRGGAEPTVTDANVVLGYLPPSLLGGEMGLDTAAATAAVAKVADAMGLETRRAAAGIVDIVNENMFGALRLVSVQQGYDPREFALVAFGGAGPLHANALGRLLGSWPVIIPPSPGGAVRLRRRHHPGPQRVGQDLHPPLLRDLQRGGGAAAGRAGHRGGGRPGRRRGRPRPAVGAVPGRRPLPRPGVRGPGRRRPGALPRRRAGARRPGVRRRAHPAVHLRPRHRARAGEPAGGGPGPGHPGQGRGGPGRRPRPGRRGHRHHHHLGLRRRAPATVYDRARLEAGNRVPGPAVVTEMDSTTLILPDHVGEVDRYGNLLLRPASSEGS